MGYKETRIIKIDDEVYEKLRAKDGDLTDLEKVVKSSVLTDNFVTLGNSGFQTCLGVGPAVPKRSTRRINEFLEEMGESKIDGEISKDFIDGFQTAIGIVTYLMEKETADTENRLDRLNDIYNNDNVNKEQEEEEKEL